MKTMPKNETNEGIFLTGRGGSKGQSALKNGVVNFANGSNPPLSAITSLNLTQKRLFKSPFSKSCQPIVPKTNYKLATIHHQNYDLAKQWYIEFYAFSIAQDRVKRCRIKKPINYEKTVTARLRVADGMVKQINRELVAGLTLDKIELDTVRTTVTKMSLLQALEYVETQKRNNGHRAQYIHNFLRLKNNVTAWLTAINQQDFPFRKLSRDHILSFLAWMKSDRSISNKTYNNYRIDFSIAINFIIDNCEGILKTNPAEKIKKLPTVATKHAAYSDEQVKAIVDKCTEMKLPVMLLFIRFIYYTMSRPSTEIRLLKIENIDLFKRRIFFAAANDKNKTDNYVGISDRFAAIIAESGLLNYPAHFYIFGMHGPSEGKPVGYATLQRWHAHVLAALGYHLLGKKYSLYSYKHSGAVSFYYQTKDIKLLQAQCRHRNLDQTNNYLRDLGALTNFDGLMKWQGAV